MIERTQILKILDLFAVAREHIQYPKIRLEGDLQLFIAGDKAKFPGSVNITNGVGYMQSGNKWYGRITTDGTIKLAPHLTKVEALQVTEQLELFAENPAEYAKMYGKGTGICMFCGKQLTDPQSVAVGYGPICADHYGLPHGEMEQEIAESMSQIEISLPTTDELPISDYMQEAYDRLVTVQTAIETAIMNAESPDVFAAINDAMCELVQVQGLIAYDRGCKGEGLK